MKKITDERLILRNLQHIRIVYIVQTLGILVILGYELFQGGLDGMRENPVWLVFMISIIIYTYLTMSTSVDHEKQIKSPKKSLMIGLLVVLVIAITLGFFTSITPGFNWGNGALISSIIIFCGAIPVYYIYRLRLKKLDDIEE